MLDRLRSVRHPLDRPRRRTSLVRPATTPGIDRQQWLAPVVQIPGRNPEGRHQRFVITHTGIIDPGRDNSLSRPQRGRRSPPRSRSRIDPGSPRADSRADPRGAACRSPAKRHFSGRRDGRPWAPRRRRDRNCYPTGGSQVAVTAPSPLTHSAPSAVTNDRGGSTTRKSAALSSTTPMPRWKDSPSSHAPTPTP